MTSDRRVEPLHLQRSRTMPWWRSSVDLPAVRPLVQPTRTGNGIGDLDGITARLEHIASLGVDGLWLNPCYPSPNKRRRVRRCGLPRRSTSSTAGLPAFRPPARRGPCPRTQAADGPRPQPLLRPAPVVPGRRSPRRSRIGGTRSGSSFGKATARTVVRCRRTTGTPSSVVLPWTRLSTTDGTPEQWYLHSFDSDPA